MEVSNKDITKTLEQLKDDMIDTYLAMLEQSERKKYKIIINSDSQIEETITGKVFGLEDSIIYQQIVDLRLS